VSVQCKLSGELLHQRWPPDTISGNVLGISEVTGRYCAWSKHDTNEGKTLHLWFNFSLTLVRYQIVDVTLHKCERLTDDPPQSRSAPGRSAPRSPQTRSIRPNFWDDPPQVLGRSAPIKLHQIWTEVGINDDAPWTIAVGWIGNSNGMNVQHTLASSILTPVEWADLWRHPSSMSRAGAARSAQQWSRLNVCLWSNAKTGVNSPTHCWQTPCNGSSKMSHSKHLPLYGIVTRTCGGSSIRVITDTMKMWSARRWTSDMKNKFNKCRHC